MKKLINKVAEKFNGTVLNGEVAFSFGSDDFHFTGEHIYSVIGGEIFGLGAKAKSMRSVENYVATVADGE